MRYLPLLTLLLAGGIHLAIAPEHYNHSPVHGIFFVGVGLVEIGWALAFWRRPTVTLFQLGVALAGSLVVLWIVTRILPAPFGHGPEPVNASGLVCKASELLGLFALAMLALQGQLSGVASRALQPLVGQMLGLSLAIGLVLFGVGHAAAMVLPAEWARPAAMEHEHKHGHDTEEHAPPAPGKVIRAEHLQIQGIWARPAPVGDTTAVYLTVVNTGDHADALVAVQSDVAVAELHETYLEGEKMHMRPVARLEIPARGKLELKPGSYHIMLINLKRALTAGEHVPLHLKFEHTGEVTVEAEVLAR